ncbi:MAG TPA: hypothetical protein VFX38_02110 [Gammaproteobacteria bacterium]|nr:hypothetical protein [Gammaproteobacteria bacterium]
MSLSELLRYAGWLILAALALAAAAMLGYSAPWYFAWAIGTAMIILIASFAGALYDRQARDEGEED